MSLQKLKTRSNNAINDQLPRSTVCTIYIVIVLLLLLFVINIIPSRKSRTPTIMGSNCFPALLATHCTPKARSPARVVPHILFTLLYIVEPAI